MKTSTGRLLTISLILFLTTLVSHSQDWPQWRGTNRDGKAAGFENPKAWPEQLTQKWKVTVGLGDATPALVKDRIYVYSKVGENEVLLCIDASSGKQLWQSPGYPAPAVTGPAASHPGPRSSVAVAEGKAVAVGVAGDIACFDASSGKLIWRNEDFKGQVPQFFTGMSPLISSGVCYAHLGGPKSGSFVAFDLVTGSVKWKADVEAPPYGSPVLMTIDGTKQVVFQGQTKLTSLNLADGKQLWELETPVGTGRVNNAASPVADGNRVFYTGLNNGVNAAEIIKAGNNYTINKLWSNPEFTTVYNTPVLKDGFLYGISSQSRLFCIDAGTGKTAWTDETALQNFGSIVDAGQVLIALTSNSHFVVLKPDGQKFNKIAQLKLAESGIYSHPIVSGNRIFIKDVESLTQYTVN
ncbi:MAG: PQQ-binding-like beta-propeller repeat protein [Bacteroidales bacterium]|jgi:outer membrane protein assembly factor BamB|nr:PQQ-binding-like beta-propeller repeat protein [Bacteroidales bacterium]